MIQNFFIWNKKYTFVTLNTLQILKTMIKLMQTLYILCFLHKDGTILQDTSLDEQIIQI